LKAGSRWRNEDGPYTEILTVSLQSVRTTGHWESWIKFFLTGVIEVANQPMDTARAVLALFNEDRTKIVGSDKSTTTVLAIHAYLQRHPVATTTRIKEASKVSLPTVLRGLATLQGLGIVREATGKDRHNIFVYQAYLNILNQGTEPFASM